MARNFYYGSDARVVAGSAVFAALIGSSPESFGIQPWLAEQYVALDAVLQEQYRLSLNPETKTPVVNRAKDDALRACQRMASTMAAICTRTPTVSDPQLVSLGLQPRRNRTRRAGPTTIPTVTVVRVINRTVRIRIDARQAEGTRLAKGAYAACVYSYLGDEPPSSLKKFKFETVATRATADIVFPNNTPEGARAWISAAWFSKRGERGLGSPPVRVILLGGPVLAKGA
jgi:hypothetical protein